MQKRLQKILQVRSDWSVKSTQRQKFADFAILEKYEDTQALCMKMDACKDYVAYFLVTICNISGGQAQCKQKMVTQTLRLNV